MARVRGFVAQPIVFIIAMRRPVQVCAVITLAAFSSAACAAPPPISASATAQASGLTAADPFALAPTPAASHPPLTEAVIHEAIHETLVEADRQAAAERQAVANKQMQPGVAAGGVVYRGSAEADILSAAFDQAQIPSCLHPDGLKFQPTYVFFGLLALPFVAVAKLRGKCD
jgi:hypothetical protein